MINHNGWKIRVIGGHGNYRARCDEAQLERSHRTKKLAVMRLQLALDDYDAHVRRQLDKAFFGVFK